MKVLERSALDKHLRTSEELREELFYVRTKVKMTQQQIAEKVGVSNHTLWSFMNPEKGKHYVYATSDLTRVKIQSFIDDWKKEHGSGQ